ncbi:uncharacterized protein EI90DRAFT_3011559 [Cantharellus anzutake]|uniref:uncharacterized protein n=1 Tax=Cantharellus anzutake TaxID=1750568 RepID=UPI001905F4AF|nr:uncharacterized protein EI90DRAFT_3011559 [Cantharellus anzutake]KAF8341972.1 hypothetical protein EI90DRAFT_3011559 [Cantharellus anzutake]
MTLHYARCFLPKKAATQPFHHDSTVGGAFFGSWMSGIHSSPTSVLSPTPQPSLSEPDDGISFLNTGDMDDATPSDNPDPIANDLPHLDDQFTSDTQLYNSIVLYCNLLHLYEFNTSVHDGDIGRTFEVIHWLHFYFFGIGSNNYGNELLQQARDFWWHLPTATQTAILLNYLVNPSGFPGHFHKQDLLQEHLNFWLNFMGMVGLARVHPGRTQVDIRADINCLRVVYLWESHHLYIPGRSQTTKSNSLVNVSINCLSGPIVPVNITFRRM